MKWHTSEVKTSHFNVALIAEVAQFGYHETAHFKTAKGRRVAPSAEAAGSVPVINYTAYAVIITTKGMTN